MKFPRKICNSNMTGDTNALVPRVPWRIESTTKSSKRSKRTATRNSEAPRTNFRRQASYFFKKSSVRVTSRFMQITGREFEATHKLPPLTGQYLEAMKYSPARFLTIVATHPTATGLYDRERRLIRAKFSLKRRNITRKRAP